VDVPGEKRIRPKRTNRRENFKGDGSSGKTANTSERNQRRIEYIQSLLVDGYHTCRLVDMCEVHRLFEMPCKKDGAGRPKILTRKAIRALIDAAKAKYRKNKIDPEEEITKMYDRLLQAYRIAKRRGDARGMAVSCKEINRMVGLRGQQERPIDSRQIVSDLKDMDYFTSPDAPDPMGG